MMTASDTCWKTTVVNTNQQGSSQMVFMVSSGAVLIKDGLLTISEKMKVFFHFLSSSHDWLQGRLRSVLFYPGDDD